MLTTQAQPATDLGLDAKPLKTARFHLPRKITGLKADVTDPSSHGYGVARSAVSSNFCWQVQRLATASRLHRRRLSVSVASSTFRHAVADFGQRCIE
jgi:hypothetical protein